MIKLLFIFFFMSFSAYSAERFNLENGETAMQISLQKELNEILINDSNEVQAEYKLKKIFYQNKELNKYKAILLSICHSEKVLKCPEIYFTTRDLSGIASMYPNQVLAINEKLMKRINLNEATFILAHEFAHYKFQHSKQRTKIIAKSVVDNSLMIREPEQALASSGFMPDVVDAHHRYEDEADAYAFEYIKARSIKINCLGMFKKIIGKGKVIHDKHHPIKQRCEQYSR